MLVWLIAAAKILAKAKPTLLEEAETRPEALQGLSPQLREPFTKGGGIDEMRETVRLLEEAEAPRLLSVVSKDAANCFVCGGLTIRMSGGWDKLGEFVETQFVDDRAKRLVDRGLRRQEEGRFGEAAEDYETAIAIAETYVDPHHFLANTYSQLDRLDESLSEYRIALTLARKHLPKSIREDGILQILYNLSLTVTARQASHDGYCDAARDFKKVCRGLKLPPAFHVALGNVLVSANQKREAIREYERYLAKKGGSDIADTIRASVAELRAMEIGEGSNGTPSQGKRKWWQFWKSDQPIVGSRDESRIEVADQERHVKSFDGKTKKCINCNELLSASDLECPACGSDRFIWS